MAYKLSDRRKQDTISAKNNDSNNVDLGKVGTVFIIFALLGLLTAWVYSFEAKNISDILFYPDDVGTTEIGPINVKKYNEVYNVAIKAEIRAQTWSFIEGQVLNSDREYLFAFGKELWHEQGRDSDGTWREAENDYSINVTLPQPGAYYLRFNIESNRPPNRVAVTVIKKRGSSLPHLWFGIVALIIGLVLNERRNRTIGNILGKVE